MPGLNVNDAGTWKPATPWVNDGGTWKKPTKVWANDGGVWKQVWAAGPPPPTFTPPAGSYTRDDGTATTVFTLTASEPVVWTWSKTGYAGATADVVSGGTASSITFSITAPTNSFKSSTFSVSAAGQSWDITISATNGTPP